MVVLGIAALYHDSSAAVIRDGEIVAAAQEERFTRKKADRSIPFNAIDYCMKAAGIINGSDLDAVVYYDDPVLTLNRFIRNIAADGHDSDDLIALSFDSMFRQKLWIEKTLRDKLYMLGKEDTLYVSSHHLSHAASAFFPSPFRSSAILTADGVGEWNTTTLGFGEDNSISILKKIEYPDSLGLLYSAFTWFCGFRVNFGDYKLMGLAPYGEPVYRELIEDNLIDIKEDGSFKLNLDYFDFQYGRSMTNSRFSALFGGERRLPEDLITKREMDLAASVQKVTEEIMMRLASTAKKLTGSSNLVLAGGVALNCVANGILDKTGFFDNIWVQPASGDAGGSIGAALAYYYQYLHNGRTVSPDDSMKGSFLGPCYSDSYIQSFLSSRNLPFHVIPSDDTLCETVARLIDEQKVTGLFQGRMEFGPRALGHRSIIADPRSPQMQSRLNLSIKKRESFRPFAPAVLSERVSDYFDTDHDSPYMLFCTDVLDRLDEEFSVRDDIETDPDLIKIINRKRSDIPAVTHVDYSARLQTVDKKRNPEFHRIIKAFEDLTGCGVVINTSFNVRGEPIVCSPEDAYNCFMNTDMDVLVLEHCVLYKAEQPSSEKRNDSYELD